MNLLTEIRAATTIVFSTLFGWGVSVALGYLLLQEFAAWLVRL